MKKLTYNQLEFIADMLYDKRHKIRKERIYNEHYNAKNLVEQYQIKENNISSIIDIIENMKG